MLDAMIAEQIKQFQTLCERLSRSYFVEALAEHVVIIHPKASKLPRDPRARDVDLTLLALVHGVEVAGAAVLTRFLAKLEDGSQTLSGPLGVALGNIPAALQGTRFVERDLNRSFSRSETGTAEDRRADQLELLLKRTRYLVDFHQVKLPSANPFWIFPYHKEGISFARAVAADIPIVTHWNGGFSSDGQCSDEFVIKGGGCGVTIELGQNGFDPRQIQQGVFIAQGALKEVQLRVSGETRGPRMNRPTAAIYTWADVLSYPDTGGPVLDQGWTNFAKVFKGQRLGSFMGDEIVSSHDGWLLFPKYPDRRGDGTYGEQRPAAELVRIMREVRDDELPK